jgi:hypothetical protein
MEGVERSWPLDRRLLKPVRIPVPPHPHEEPQARAAERAARRSRGRPRGLPLESCRLETRLAADLELDDLGRARCLLGACRDPDEVQVHLALLSVFDGRRATPSFSESAAGIRLRPGYTQTALSPLSYGRRKEPPAGVEPAPRPYKGRVLAVDTTEANVEMVGVEPTSSSVQARRSSS